MPCPSITDSTPHLAPRSGLSAAASGMSPWSSEDGVIAGSARLMNRQNGCGTNGESPTQQTPRTRQPFFRAPALKGSQSRKQTTSPIQGDTMFRARAGGQQRAGCSEWEHDPIRRGSAQSWGGVGGNCSEQGADCEGPGGSDLALSRSHTGSASRDRLKRGERLPVRVLL